MPSAKRYGARIFIMLWLWLPFSAAGQLKKYDFSQVDSLQQSARKTVIVFIHADWCKFCATMNGTTFKDKEIVKKINEHFYFITLNAEEKKDIRFNGHTFKYKQSGSNTGLHELATQLAGVETSYPTLCFLNYKNEIIYQHKDFIKAKQLASFLELF